MKNPNYHSQEITLGGGYANGFEEHVFNIPYEESVNTAFGLNLNYCYFINEEIGAGIRTIGYYKTLPEYIIVDQNGIMKSVNYDLINYTLDGEFRYIFSRNKIEPYGFLLLGFSGGDVSGGGDELSFYGFNTGIGAGVKIPVGKHWRISGELFGIVGTAKWEEKPFINSKDDDFNPSTAGILLNVSYVFGH